MGTTTAKTFVENSGSGSKSTWTVQFRGSDITVDANTTEIVCPNLQCLIKYVGTNKGYADAFVGTSIRITSGSNTGSYYRCNFVRNSGGSALYVATTSGTVYTITSTPSVDLLTPTVSDIFNSNNPTLRTATMTIYKSSGSMFGNSITLESSGKDSTWTNQSSIELANTSPEVLFDGAIGTITLNAPPTFKVVDGEGVETTSVSFDTPYVYAGLTTASIGVSEVTALFGGNIASIAFTIGGQTVTSTTDGTMSIPLNVGGTFTPTVTVTDSRGQVTTKSLDAITVGVYTIPSVSFSVERTDSTGIDDDEGESAVVEANFNWTDAVATLTAPTVSVSDTSGTVLSITSTWYKNRASDGTLSSAIADWSEITKNDMPVYCLIDNSSHAVFDTQYSYQVSITPNDSEQSGTTIIQIVSGAFYTIDFLAGGHGIAFGQACHGDGFECSFPSTFNNDFYFKLDTDTASGTDHDIYTALVALGWDSDVIVN